MSICGTGDKIERDEKYLADFAQARPTVQYPTGDLRLKVHKTDFQVLALFHRRVPVL